MNLCENVFETTFANLPANGWLLYDEAKLLLDVASKTTGSILEVGSYYGRSTVLLASLGRPVYAVDPFDNFDSDLTGEQVKQFLRANLEERNITNVTIFQEKIEDWYPVQGCEIGFAYLDGDHTYEGSIAQIKAAINAGVKHMCIHDYSTRGGGRNIKKAIEDSPIKLIGLMDRMAHCVISN